MYLRTLKNSPYASGETNPDSCGGVHVDRPVSVYEALSVRIKARRAPVGLLTLIHNSLLPDIYNTISNVRNRTEYGGDSCLHTGTAIGLT